MQEWYISTWTFCDHRLPSPNPKVLVPGAGLELGVPDALPGPPADPGGHIRDIGEPSYGVIGTLPAL